MTHLERFGHERDTAKNGNCRVCHRAVCARYKAAHPDRVKASRRRWLEANLAKQRACQQNYERENRDKIRVSQRTARLADPERFREYGARWRAKHPERNKTRHRAYSKAHPEKSRLWRRERRARECGTGGTHTQADVVAQLQAQAGRCYWCRTTLGTRYEVDHVIPLSRGGGNGRENIVVACRGCNRRKHNKMPEEFAGRLL